MAIYDPTLFLTETDKRLIYLLGQLVLDSETSGFDSNKTKGELELTDSEAAELLELLERFVEARRFQETSYLLENLFSGRGFDSKELRDIYLSWRKFHGKSRALATDQWELVLSRLGIATRYYGDTPWYRKDASPMTLEHFYKMEQKLLKATGVSVRVQALVLSYVRLKFGYLDAIRSEQVALEKGQIAKKPVELLKMLRKDMRSKVGGAAIPTTKIAATMTIVIDLSAAYTTRDWSVASFMSAIAGAAPAAILD